MLAALPSAQAQYAVQEWANFEDGKLPASAVTIGSDSSQALKVVELGNVAGMPAQFGSPQIQNETGRHVLCLHHAVDSSSPKPVEGLLLGRIIERDALSQDGRVLLQADIFLPEGEVLPRVALLAMEQPSGVAYPPAQGFPSVTGAFYRFGVNRDTKALFFSFIERDSQRPTALLQDKEFLNSVPRPGWHRFALLFEGPLNVRSYIDGNEVGFSPSQQSDLRRLALGIVLIDNLNTPYDLYVDNISIQVSQRATALPSSPYGSSWASASADTKTTTSPPAATPQPSTSASWLEPEQAWSLARQQKRPMLLYFCAPGSHGSQKLDALLSSDLRAMGFLRKHACGWVDATKPKGSALARQYRVFKLPTLLVIDPDARTHTRATPSGEESWEMIEPKLQLP